MNLLADTRRIGRVALLALALCGALIGQVADASAAAVRARLDADLTCLPAGGAMVAFTVENLGRETIAIENDFHLMLTIVERGGGRVGGPIVFVFPAPDFAVIPPGESRTFQIGMGDPVEGEPGIDLSGAALLLEAAVWFEGREQPVRRQFAFRGCPPPTP